VHISTLKFIPTLSQVHILFNNSSLTLNELRLTRASAKSRAQYALIMHRVSDV